MSSAKRVLKAMKMSEKLPSTSTSAKSPIVTGTASPSGFSRSFDTIARDASIPCTSRPRRTSGSAMRPVPIPNSRTRPPPASWTRHATAGSASIDEYHAS